MSGAAKPAKPAPCPVAKAMRQAVQQNGGGPVGLSLTEGGEFLAHAHRHSEAARSHAIAAFQRAGVNATLAQLSAEQIRAERESLAYGRGRTPLDALRALMLALAE